MADLERGAEAVRLTNEEERKCEAEQTCYTKEELEELANTGCWNTARTVLLTIFWAVWIGAIAWSIFIVIKSPKCKPEPEQAWFTNGAIGLIEGDDPVGMIETTEAGQYSAFLVSGLIPAFNQLLQLENVDELREQSTKLATLSKSKGAKLLFKVDLDESDESEKLGADRYAEYFAGYFGEQSDGFVFTGWTDAEVISSVRTANKNHDLFYQVDGDKLADIASQRATNEYFYQDLGGDVCEGVACIETAEDIIRKTSKFSNQTIDAITETLWSGQTNENGLSSEIVLTSTLPGGFIVPVVDTEDAAKYGELITLRGNTHSLRAIVGANIEFKENAITRKFDLRPEVTLTTEDLAPLEPKFDSEKSIFKIYVQQ